MITGSLKNKIDAIWQDFYNENMAQNDVVVNQLTTLMFIKMLDDRQNSQEAEAKKINVPLNDKDLIFKKGNWKNEELGVDVPYDNLRWKNFKDLNSKDLARRIKNNVFPFIKSLNGENSLFGSFVSDISYGFDDKERLLTSVVDKLSDPEIDFSNSDIMGDFYEYLIDGKISGQFRTPRHIIDMIVAMIKPKLGELIIDPAMGTAGFLIESAKYIRENQNIEIKNIARSRFFSEEMFYGVDTDKTMSRIGCMNLLLHGVKKPHLSIDSLLEGDNSINLDGKFDVVLANPPFAGSLIESATNGEILTISKTKKTELLFVALFTKLLKIGGRCASIIPDGVLFGSSSAHKSLRSYLVDKQKLIAVVSMPSGIFQPYSGVKTSFIIFEKTNKGGTDNVWFYDMQNDGYSLNANRSPIKENDCEDVLNRFNNLSNESERLRTDKSFLVPKQEIIDNDYDLTINKYKEIIKEEKVYRKSIDIIADIDIVTNEINESLILLKSMVNEGYNGKL